MSTLNINSFVAIPLSPDLYTELARRFPGQVNSVIGNVVEDFLDRTADQFDPPSKKGIQWDSVFLVEGTQIRTKYRGEYKLATIQGDEIVWEGTTYPSMSQLAYSMRGNVANNAWKVLEVKRPSDTSWIIVDYLR